MAAPVSYARVWHTFYFPYHNKSFSFWKLLCILSLIWCVWDVIYNMVYFGLGMAYLVWFIPKKALFTLVVMAVVTNVRSGCGVIFDICHRHHRTTVEKKCQIWSLGCGVIWTAASPPYHPLNTFQHLSKWRAALKWVIWVIASFQGFRFDQKTPSAALYEPAHVPDNFLCSQNRLPWSCPQNINCICFKK